ncbi:MAG: helix-turn-helix transcriptional regulator [Oscillospiraceae bacterium]|nr:helix-turn-helix transcriptional regulator [Oscillospiraceae bacterium]
MNAAEKFKSIIDTIEEHASDEHTSSSDIGILVAKKNGRSVRDMSTIFSYLTDTALSKYISVRKLNAAYRSLIGDAISKAQAAGIAGYADQSAFSTAFKKQFGITPGAAQKSRNLSLLSPPLTWAELSGDLTSESIIQEENNVGNLIFGVSQVSFEKIEKMLGLESFYGFKRMFSRYAFDLSEQTGYSIEDCFNYVESLREYDGGGDFDQGYEDDLTPDERLRECGDNKRYQQLFFTRGISVQMSASLLEEHFVKLEEILSCDPDAIRYFPGFESGIDISFSYYIRAYSYYVEHFSIDKTEETFEDYLDLITAGYPIEKAFATVYASAAVEEDINNDNLSDNVDLELKFSDLERYRQIEREAAEEAKWHDRHIDDDLYYDSENDYYNRKDTDEW